MRGIALVTLFLGTQAAMAQVGLRDDDARFSRADLEDRLSGIQIEFFDDTLASYSPDGGYVFRYSADGPPIMGTWTANDDSGVCIAFDNGFDRCDTYVVSGSDRLTLIIEDGERFPVRSETPLN